MAHSRTIIALPDNHPGATAGQQSVSQSAATLRDTLSIPLQGRMIVGVLYSVSRNLFGEIFPIYVGKNTIGSAPDNDVCLREETVYPAHAILLVRKLADENGVMHTSVSITEDTPGAGTAVNGDVLEYERVYCHDGDVISIGEHYTLSLMLLSPEARNLEPCDDFLSLPPVEAPRRDSAQPIDPYAMMYSNVPPEPTFRDSISEDDERSFYAPSKIKEPDHFASKTVADNK